MNKSAQHSLITLLFLIITASCSNMMLTENTAAASSRLLAVVDENLYPELASELNNYIEELKIDGIQGQLELAAPGTAEELKNLIWEKSSDADMVFLIGNLPYVYYEMVSFGYYEKFPVDLYFADSKAVWTDADNNGAFDSHTSLYAVKPVSRIKGSTEELKNYFSKLSSYKNGLYPPSSEAFIFKDDDWHNFYRSSSFGLERLYSKITINENEANTMKRNYTDKLSTELSAFVYQWIHASPTTLFFQNKGNYDLFFVSDIPSTAPQGIFYNLFDCKAAKFSQTNLGMNYITNTPYGLAVQGSTKTGGNYYPLEFHRSLAMGKTWSQSFIDWYNVYGTKSDAWFLGMTVFGDPALKIKSDTVKSLSLNRSVNELIPKSFSEETALLEQLVNFNRDIPE